MTHATMEEERNQQEDIHNSEGGVMNNLHDTVPMELQELTQWCRYRADWDEKNQRFTKPPISPDTGETINFTKADELRSFEKALNSSYGDGLGFALLEGGKLIGEDFDDILLDQNTAHSSFGMEVDPTTYAEITPSGRGIHQYYHCEEPFETPAPRLSVQGKSWELYSRGRYLTVTGNLFSGAPNTIRKVSADFLRKKVLVRRIIKAVSTFDKAKRLFHEPDCWQSLGYPSQSEADLFLISQIKIHTVDEEIGLRVFRLSALFRGEAKGKDYFHTTWERIEQSSKEVLELTVDDLVVHPNAESVDDRFILWFDGTPVGKPANITIIRSIAKQGKTHTIHALGATLAGAEVDTLGFTIDRDIVKNIVIIDTEQDRSDINALQRASARRAKGSALPNLHILSFRGRVGRGPDAIEWLEKVLEQYRPQIVCLDVITDFVKGTNDMTEASEAVNKLETLVVKYDCAMVVTIHTGTSEEARAKGGRGAIGSELERRAFATLQMQNDTLSVVACRRGRKGAEMKILWNDELKSYASDQVTQQERRESAAKSLFGDSTQLTAAELLKRIEDTKHVAKARAWQMINNLIAQGLIAKEKRGVYTIVDDIAF